MSRAATAVVGAAETTLLGKIPDHSELALHADAALNALDDAGLTPADIDGFAAVGQYSGQVCEYLGIQPRWIDATDVGGCSFMLSVRHAAAAIEAGLCTTVLITHGESGRSGHGPADWNILDGRNLIGQFERPYGMTEPAAMMTLPVAAYMHRYGLTEEHLAAVPVAQSRWATLNPRAYRQQPTTIDDVLDSPMIAWPFRRDMCCLVTDGGGALVLTAAERATDHPQTPVYVLGAGEALTHHRIAGVHDPTTYACVVNAGHDAFAEARLTPAQVDHLMIYDAFAHQPIYGLEDLGFADRGEAAHLIANGYTSPGGSLPLNTNGGGLRYTHTGMYGMFAMQESIRQLRRTAAAQVDDVAVSIAAGQGGVGHTAGVVIFGDGSTTNPTP